MKNRIFVICLLFSYFLNIYAYETINAKITTPYEIYKKLNYKIDLNLSFINENNQLSTIKSLFKNKSILMLTLNYYRCTTMCTFQFLNLSKALKELPLKITDNIQVASISFDPTDTPKIAKEIHNIWTPQLTASKKNLWHFYVGNSSNIASITNQLNFFYEKDDEGNYSHAGALYFIKPDGTFYRYLYGIVYDKDQISFAINDTSNGFLGNFMDSFFELFYKYNPIRGKYYSIFKSENS